MKRPIFVPECLWCDRRRSSTMARVPWNGKTHDIHHACLREMQAWLSFRGAA